MIDLRRTFATMCRLVAHRTVALMLGLTTLLAWPCGLLSAQLEVGPGKAFSRIEEAVAKAQPGDTVLVYAREDNQPYERVAVSVRQRNLTFRAMPAKAGERVTLSGKGFDYSGRGSIPRAVFQFDPGADHCTLEGFDLSAAHNDSHNGAGVRINQASHVTIRNCCIHNNDMGIMSNGDSLQSAVDQRVEDCAIHHNGDFGQPGYNHNLYLGGASVTLSGCEVHDSLTGHNVKSRAHYTRVEYCYIHDAANRELDLVDSPSTTAPGSDAVILGDVIVKSPTCKGNRTVVHFGQDGGKEHDGTVYLLFNTIVTPFAAPVLDLSSSQAKARLVGNLVSDVGSAHGDQKIVAVRNAASLREVAGEHNWFSGGFARPDGTGLDPKANRFERASMTLFVKPAGHNYRLTPAAAKLAGSALSSEEVTIPAMAGVLAIPVEPPLKWQYLHPAGKEKRPAEKGLTLGAYPR